MKRILQFHCQFYLEKDAQDAYREWPDEMADELCNKLLGHADPVQGSMELECEYATHQINCGTPAGHRTGKSRGLDKNAARRNPLMQVDSNEDIGMMWGGMGRLYLWTTEEDLAGRKFENCWLILQCGYLEYFAAFPIRNHHHTYRFQKRSHLRPPDKSGTFSEKNVAKHVVESRKSTSLPKPPAKGQHLACGNSHPCGQLRQLLRRNCLCECSSLLIQQL